MIVSFDVTKKESKVIEEIVERARLYAMRNGIETPVRMDLQMDLTAVHANGCPLRLRELAAADDFDFTHDVFGIMRHIDRKTGKLGDFFLPRFAV